MPTLEEQIEIVKKRKEQIITRERELIRRQKEKERKRINKKIFAIGRAIYKEYETNEDTEFLNLDPEEIIQLRVDKELEEEGRIHFQNELKKEQAKAKDLEQEIERLKNRSLFERLFNK